VVETIKEENLLEYVTATGAYFREQLAGLAKKHSAIVDVRGLGLMLAAELDSAELAKQVVADMLAQRILINRTSETVLRFLPPYVLKREHVDQAIAALDAIFTERAPQMVNTSSTGANKNG
jgi:acetylornithine aminotransferase/acetylornithine/N-succinyldiaminopimelate aminotransferase